MVPCSVFFTHTKHAPPETTRWHVNIQWARSVVGSPRRCTTDIELSLEVAEMFHFYPARVCVKGLSNRFCPSVSQSVSQSVSLSVCPVKHFEISTFTRLNNCCTQRWHGNLKNNNVCVPDREQNSLLLCISSPFLFKTLVLSTILIRSTTWIRCRPGICRLQACVCVPRIAKSWAGAWERGHAPTWFSVMSVDVV